MSTYVSLLGDSLLIHPVTKSRESSVQVYFPGNDALWYEVETYEVHHGPGYQTVPVVAEKVLFKHKLL